MTATQNEVNCAFWYAFDFSPPEGSIASFFLQQPSKSQDGFQKQCVVIEYYLFKILDRHQQVQSLFLVLSVEINVVQKQQASSVFISVVRSR
jgi:hypothetical protein